MRTKKKSALAKAEAEHESHCRSIYEGYDRDVKQFGRATADFNAGFIQGQNDYQERISEGRIAATLDMLGIALAEHGHKWSNAERKGYERAIAALKGIGIEYVPAKGKRARQTRATA